MHLIFQGAVEARDGDIGAQVTGPGVYVADQVTILNECSNKTA